MGMRTRGEARRGKWGWVDKAGRSKVVVAKGGKVK